MTTRIQVRRGTAASWSSINPVLAPGEFGYETDTGKVKLGNGTANWTALAYLPTLDGTGKVPLAQLPAGVVIDNAVRVDDSVQFYSGATTVGGPVSLVLAEIDGGTPTATSEGFIDGGTV